MHLVSIVLGCLVALFIWPSSYNGGGGAVVFVVLISALILRLLIGFAVDKARNRGGDDVG